MPIYPPNAPIDLSSQVSRAPGVVSAELAGEAAILDPEKGLYFGLNEVGARIWQHLASPKPLAEVVSLILSEYDVEEERCVKDLIRLLAVLEEKGLVEIASP